MPPQTGNRPQAWASEARLQAWLGGAGGQTGAQTGAGLAQGQPQCDEGDWRGPLGLWSVRGRLSHFSGDRGLTGQVQASKKLNQLMSTKPRDCP